MGAPLGLVGSLEGSWRPSRPNQAPQCIGNTWPFLVIRPAVLTRNTAAPVVPMVTVTFTAVEVRLLPAASNAFAVYAWAPLLAPVSAITWVYGDVVSVPSSVVPS